MNPAYVQDRKAVGAEVGGKAGVLLELQANGFPVPSFEVSPESIEACVEQLGFPLVVRSSASTEDGADFSFAGQFESYLDLNSRRAVVQAMEACEHSVQSERVRDYCEHAGVSFDSVRMHVIVQRMIRPEISGVAFSVNPVTGQEAVVIEATKGLGDDLLAGKTNALAEDDPLLDRYRGQIEELVRRVQHFFGSPQDIEFAVEEGTVYLLQARPITRVQFTREVGEWTNADFRDGGVSCTVCSPLMWSLYEKVWNDSLKSSLHAIHLRGDDFTAGRMFFGRPYWNLGVVKERVSRIPGFVEREFDEDIGVQTDYEGDGLRRPFSLAGLFRLIPVAWGVSRFLARQWRIAEQTVAAGVRPIDDAGQSAICDPEQRWVSLIQDHYLPLETSYFKTIFALSLAKLDFHRCFPDADFNELATGLPPLSHMAPERWFSQADESGAQAWSEHFAHHCRFGIDVIHPRWDEDNEFVERWIADLCSQSGGAEHLSRELDGDIPRMPTRSGQRKLVRLRRLIWLREEMRNLSNRMYYHIRRCALKLAEQRFLDDDVFFMSFEQLACDDRSTVEQARWTYEAYRNYSAPNEIGSSFGKQPISTAASRADVWQGLAAGRGVVQGQAVVARTVEEALRAPAGSVLICPFTEPGWTPALGRAAAVVTETGGMLSHAAVICREYDLPAVLGVAEATEQIVTGTQVEVDGMSGTVRRLRQTS